MTTSYEIECRIEAALLTSAIGLTHQALRDLFTPALNETALIHALNTLQTRWQNRDLYLTQTATGWRFAIRDTAAMSIPHLYERKEARYSQALLETLTIIAYHQPVTRAEIELIRGVSVASNLMQNLQQHGWITSAGQKDSPGRPTLWVTTAQFLSDFSLNNLNELPDLASLKPTSASHNDNHESV